MFVNFKRRCVSFTASLIGEFWASSLTWGSFKSPAQTPSPPTTRTMCCCRGQEENKQKPSAACALGLFSASEQVAGEQSFLCLLRYSSEEEACTNSNRSRAPRGFHYRRVCVCVCGLARGRLLIVGTQQSRWQSAGPWEKERRQQSHLKCLHARTGSCRARSCQNKEEVNYLQKRGGWRGIESTWWRWCILSPWWCL